MIYTLSLFFLFDIVIAIVVFYSKVFYIHTNMNEYKCKFAWIFLVLLVFLSTKPKCLCMICVFMCKSLDFGFCVNFFSLVVCRVHPCLLYYRWDFSCIILFLLLMLRLFSFVFLICCVIYVGLFFDCHGCGFFMFYMKLWFFFWV